MNQLTNQNEYKNFILNVATKIKQTQVKLAVSVNSGLLHFYFELGGMISQKQKESKWGAKFIETMAKDIKKEFPNLKGFSRTNLFSMKKFYEFYYPYLVHQDGGLIENKSDEIVQLYGGQLEDILFSIPWRHHVEILNKVKTIEEASYYIEQTIEQNWIGILLCRDKNNIEAEFSLRDINKPMGVSEFELTEILPENLKSSLPTIEEFEAKLGDILEDEK